MLHVWLLRRDHARRFSSEPCLEGRSALTSGLTLSLARCVESFQHELNHILHHILGGMSEPNLNGMETIWVHSQPCHHLTILGPSRDPLPPYLATGRVLQEISIRIIRIVPGKVKTRQWLLREQKTRQRLRERGSRGWPPKISPLYCCLSLTVSVWFVLGQNATSRQIDTQYKLGWCGAAAGVPVCSTLAS